MSAASRLAKRTYKKGAVDDLVLLEEISEDSVAENLRNRFKEDKIYTSIGPVLLSMNPFKSLRALYSSQMINAYCGRQPYGALIAAYKCMSHWFYP